MKSHENLISNPVVNGLLNCFSTLLYEYFVILDPNSRKILFHNHNTLFNRVNYKNEDLSESFAIESIYINSNNIDITFIKILSIIKQRIELCCFDNKSLLFVFDCLIKSNDTIKGLIFNTDIKASIKISPYFFENEKYLLLMMIALPTRIDTTHLTCCNTTSGERSTYDFSTDSWCKDINEHLSIAEHNILALSTKGLSVRQIADTIHRSEDTVKAIRKQINTKLGVSNITEAIGYAITHKLI